MMTTEERQAEEVPAAQLEGDGPQCGKFVATEDGHDLVCDLPAGHPESTPCSASLDRRTVS
jgi:hypothetical protein